MESQREHVNIEEQLNKAKKIIPTEEKESGRQKLLESIQDGYITPEDLSVYYFIKTKYELIKGEIKASSMNDIYKEAREKYGVNNNKINEIIFKIDPLRAGIAQNKNISFKNENIPFNAEITAKKTSDNRVEIKLKSKAKTKNMIPAVNVTLTFYKDNKPVSSQKQIVWFTFIQPNEELIQSTPLIPFLFDTIKATIYMNVTDMHETGIQSSVQPFNVNGEAIVPVQEVMIPLNTK